MRVLLLSRYDRLGASSRVRFMQYLSYLSNKGIETDVSPLFSNAYLTALYTGQPRWREVFSGCWSRVKILFKIPSYDLIWLEKELFPFCPAIIERLFNLFGVSYVVDYDDAIFHNYDQHRYWLVRMFLGKKIDVVMRCSALVIAGNEYLAQRARDAGAKKIEIIPTVVDSERYTIVPKSKKQPLVVGWMGSPSTQHYLCELSPVFEQLKKQFTVCFVAVGAIKHGVDDVPVDVLPWTEATEIQSIQRFDIGIMPLSDSPWERGKCGYKLIQYMACGVPVVASAVGVNKQIIQHGVNGFLVKDFSDWERMLSTLLCDQVLRQKMGVRGREQVESWYSLQVQAPRLVQLLHQTSGK